LLSSAKVSVAPNAAHMPRSDIIINVVLIITDIGAEVETKKDAPVVVEPPKPNRKPSTTRGGRYYQRGGPKPAISSTPAEGEGVTSPTGEKKCE